MIKDILILKILLLHLIKTYNVQAVFLFGKQIAGCTLHGHASQCCRVLNRTHKVREVAQNVRDYYAKKDGGKTAANKSFPGFLGAQLDQRCLAKEEAKHVGHDIIADNHGDGHNKPN